MQEPALYVGQLVLAADYEPAAFPPFWLRHGLAMLAAAAVAWDCSGSTMPKAPGVRQEQSHMPSGGKPGQRP